LKKAGATVRPAQRPRAQRLASVEVSEAGGLRTLHLGGPAIQSAMRLASPNALALAYTRAMMAFLLFKPAPREVLMVGLGGGSIARFVHARLPQTRLTVLELNPQVVAAARTFFGLPLDDDRLKVVVADAARYVPACRVRCHVLLLDAFDDGRSVRSLATRPFYKACADVLAPGGILVVNFIADEKSIDVYLARIERVFAGWILRLPSEDGVNTIVLAFKAPEPHVVLATLRRAARVLERRHRIPFARFVKDFVKHNPTIARYIIDPDRG
jgi:spermidine synthase